ncbi:Protein of unknown function DUF89 [Acididesulfobacillus acetoxydans]|uniref:Conserved protein n=1 Tax=Acididesulfobacillus acetoxydans TaxID=1561005 RepID=A0A8S0XWX5_9FIRM|nr:ARMT1-like domain-containing protein [Acididesulfobacillus acetoxydans]CAA7601337.1 Protein of unknown function DUF89 [Acididesulfobacillus acetoxydans]CEJ09369.1 Conserved protein [Acididesulfobacillus acetoxydans]
MQVVMECIPCYFKQIVNTLKVLKINDQEGQRVLLGVLPLLPGLDPEATPAENSSLIFRKVYELIANEDPYAQAKAESNSLALGMLPKLREVVSESADPLHTACSAAVAGNIIDMGILPDYDLEASLKDALSAGFALDDYPAFREKLKTARSVLILGDNSGEIAFDTLLTGELCRRGVEVVYAVKGEPILNDATLADARQVGMDETARVITNGNGFLGTILKHCSPEFLKAFEEADIIISKGQANFESLESTEEAGEKTFFLLRAKCEVVAQNLGTEFGVMVFRQNQPRREN